MPLVILYFSFRHMFQKIHQKIHLKLQNRDYDENSLWWQNRDYDENSLWWQNRKYGELSLFASSQLVLPQVTLASHLQVFGKFTSNGKTVITMTSSFASSHGSHSCKSFPMKFFLWKNCNFVKLSPFASRQLWLASRHSFHYSANDSRQILFIFFQLPASSHLFIASRHQWQTCFSCKNLYMPLVTHLLPQGNMPQGIPFTQRIWL